MNIMLHTEEVDLITSEVTVKDFLNLNEREITRNNKFVNAGNIKPIPDFPNFYISDQGKVYHTTKWGKTTELQGSKIKTGYLKASLRKNGKMYSKFIHRLVLSTFAPIPEMEKYQVNHKSEQVTDNRLENLEWCTAKYNCNYGSHNKNLSRALKGKIAPNRKKVLQFDQKYNLITSYESIKEAAKALSTSKGTISNYCRNLKLFRNSFYLQYEN